MVIRYDQPPDATANMEGTKSRKKVLVLGSPLDYIEREYLEKFEEDYVLDVCNP